MSKVKYYLCQIGEINGEREYHTSVRLKASSVDNAMKKLDTIAKDWYGDEPSNVGSDDYLDGYYWFDTEVVVYADGVVEINKETFDDLNILIPDLTKLAKTK